jgi:hypothetical protein
MKIVHIVNGDAAAESLSAALDLAGRDERVIALKDDLAIGPLADIDDTSTTRGTFWRQVLSDRPIDVDAKLAQQDELLRALVRDDSQVVAWHGQSAADQLTLRRVAYYLRNAPQRLNEARLFEDDLPLVADADGAMRRASRPDHATATGMFPPKSLLAKLPAAAPISVLRISRLALEWQEAKHANAETRRWRENMLVPGTFAEIDEAVLDAASTEFVDARRIAATVMTRNLGLVVSDALAFWRMRELTVAGRLKIRGTLADIAQAEVRR